MRKGLTTLQKRLIFIFSGVLIFLLTFFLVFQRNMDEVTKLETENIKLSGQVHLLSELQTRVNQMKQTTEQFQQNIEKNIKAYPCKITQQRVISKLYEMMMDSGVELTSIKPGAEQTFFKDGKFLTLSEEDNTNTGQAQDTKISEVEKNPEKKVPFNQMVGKVTSYEIELNGTRKQIMKALDWISQNPEQMSLSTINLSFDASTGKLTGAVTVNFYCLNGNGVPYEEPDISSIILGNKDVFGTFKK